MPSVPVASASYNYLGVCWMPNYSGNLLKQVQGGPATVENNTSLQRKIKTLNCIRGQFLTYTVTNECNLSYLFSTVAGPPCFSIYKKLPITPIFSNAITINHLSWA